MGKLNFTLYHRLSVFTFPSCRNLHRHVCRSPVHIPRFIYSLNISQSVFLYKGGLSQSSLSSDTNFHSKQYSCIAVLPFDTMKLASNCRASVVNSLPSSWPVVPAISQFNTFLLSTGGREQMWLNIFVSFYHFVRFFQLTAQMDHWPTEATKRMILQGCFCCQTSMNGK